MKKKTLGLTGNQLKLFALLAMTVDHIGLLLIPGGTMLYYICRIVGRLAMPIFAWMIAEGCRYTRNRTRYLLTLLGFGLFSQTVLLVFVKSLYLSIFITFALSCILIFTLEYSLKKKSFFSLCLLGGCFAVICYICVFLPGDLSGTDFSVDYGIFGVLLPVLVYMGRSKQEKLLSAACALVALAIGYGWIQWFALLSLPLLALYNGEKGKCRLKYLFYIYYPLHLGVLYGIELLLSMCHR